MVHHPPMTTPQRLPPSLTPLDTALATLLDGLEPLAPSHVALTEALGCIAADNPPLPTLPAHDVAAADGWAFCARDLVGASSYSPLLSRQPPVWVEAGDAMPRGCDCVVDIDLVEISGALAQVVAEASPGQGIRRAGDDFPAAGAVIASGQPLRALDLLLARAAELPTLAVRRPHLHLVNVPAATASIDITAHLIVEQARAAGVAVSRSDAAARDATAIATALAAQAGDLVITIGGTGVGRRDAAVEALAAHGTLLAHAIALAPGRTTAIGKIASVPVVALPGAPDQALAAWWTLALPVLDRLSARLPRPQVSLPLVRKIASGIGVTEVALLKKFDQTWMPLASGELSLAALAGADAWFAVPAASEGFAAGTAVKAYMLRD
jgi:molybdopterin biosynthesis enzyme